MQKKDKSSSSRREDTSSRRDADSRRSPSGRREEISEKDLKKTSGGGTKAENDKLGRSQQRSQQRFTSG